MTKRKNEQDIPRTNSHNHIIRCHSDISDRKYIFSVHKKSLVILVISYFNSNVISFYKIGFSVFGQKINRVFS